MGSFDISTLAAAALAGVDLLAAATQDAAQARMQPYFREITEVGFVGSAQPNDCAIRLFVGGQQYSTYVITTGGANVAPQPQRDIKVLSKPIPVPAGALVSAIMTANATTNPVVLHLEFTDKPKTGKSWTGGGGKRRRPGRRF